MGLPVMVPDADPWGLTQRQRQFTAALYELDENKRIAMHYGVSPRTVEYTLERAMRKVGARSRVQLAVEWDRFVRRLACK